MSIHKIQNFPWSITQFLPNIYLNNFYPQSKKSITRLTLLNMSKVGHEPVLFPEKKEKEKKSSKKSVYAELYTWTNIVSNFMYF